MTNTDLQEKVRLVKLHLRGVMNGVVSQSIRDRGVNYRLIFGVDIPRLQQLSEEIEHSADLASALWKEDVRECRLLATMIYPPTEFCTELADIWIEQMKYPEEAECAVMFLFSKVKGMSSKLFEWISSEQSTYQHCGWLLLGRYLSMKLQLSKRDTDEIFDHAESALKCSNGQVRNAAYKTLMKLMEVGDEEERRGEKILENLMHS